MLPNCDIKWSGNSLASLCFLVLFPPLFYVAMQVGESERCFHGLLNFRKQFDWNACKRLSELLYTALFLFVVLEAGKFNDITCFTETEIIGDDGTSTVIPQSIQCEELGCEVLWYSNPVPEDCQICKQHFQVADILLVFVYLVAPATALIITVTQDWEVESENKFLLYKCIHSVNVVVWYGVALTLKLFRCSCRFSWVIDNITSVFAPLVVVLLMITFEAQRNGKNPGTTQSSDMKVAAGSRRTEDCESVRIAASGVLEVTEHC